MPIWPFKKRRRSVTKDEASQPLTEKPQPSRAATYPPATSTPPVPIPRKSSKRGTLRKRRPSNEDKAAEAQWTSEKPPTSSEKDNVPPSRRRANSREDITALPMSRRLESSPHLRPVDLEKPPIPYNFRTYSGSQTSIQREPDVYSPPRPGTLRSRRSGYDSVPSRVQSSKRKKDAQLREEEIRAMSAQMSIPKRPGDGPLRRDSKKMRSLGMRDSNVSLPPAEESVSSMSAILEQRGWEIGSIDVFNPRPAVRLSGTPQYISPSSMPVTTSSPLASPTREKEKMPASRSSAKKRETIGNRADDLDASDIRRLMERDAKRREKRRLHDQEKLDKKLRSRGGRNRGDSDKRRRETEEVRSAEEARQRAEEENRVRELAAAQTAIHPALRDVPPQEPLPAGLGIGEEQAEPGASEAEDHPFQTPLETPPEQRSDPFADPPVDEDATPTLYQDEQASPPRTASSDVQMEDTAIETAKEVRLSQPVTPPLSPIQTARPPNSISQVMDARRASDFTPPPPIVDQRRVSDPKPERRAGAWATFFRRGGTKLQRTEDGKVAPSEHSFSNTSRESMRNQPLPAHLVDTQMQQTRRKSGTPVRTQSKFREDLPELPISPPDSRLPSPDVTTAAAAAAAARRAGRSPAQPQDIAMVETDPQSASRSDTPVTPNQHRITSMASIDSEGSWLASGSGKRQSAQSALGQRRPEFTDSYEELGGDRDAEYVNRPTSSAVRKISTPALAGPDPDEESGEDEPAGLPPGTSEEADPMTVHESVRRKPTLVHRDPRVKSREGLLTEYTADEATPIPTSAGTGRGSLDFDPEEPEPELQRASSVGYGKGHARNFSAGSAKLFEVPPRSPTTQPSVEE